MASSRTQKNGELHTSSLNAPASVLVYVTFADILLAEAVSMVMANFKDFGWRRQNWIWVFDVANAFVSFVLPPEFSRN